jgi:DNA-directed RNA polymerase subunit E'/Rpb7
LKLNVTIQDGEMAMGDGENVVEVKFEALVKGDQA